MASMVGNRGPRPRWGRCAGRFLCGIAGLGLFGLAGAGCATIYTANGLYYRVQPGETLGAVARKFHLPLQELAELNNIENPTALRAGQRIYIPKSGGQYPAERVARRAAAKAKVKKGAVFAASDPDVEDGEAGEAIELDHGRFHWPIGAVEISSAFGIRRGRKHDGIDLRAPRGTPVKAAAPGLVVYSARLRGYGNLIIIKHSDNFFTTYAHNEVNLVKKGSKVKAGQMVAKVGSTGRATGPHLHFEVRKGSQARNPLFFLPKGGVARNEVTDDEAPPRAGRRHKKKEARIYGGP